MLKKYLAVVCIPLAFAACRSNVEVNYKVTKPVNIELYAESYYSTLDLQGEEKLGTVNAAYVDETYSGRGDTIDVKRSFAIDKSRGYLKNSMPADLQWRLPDVRTTGLGQRVIALSGFENYDSLLNHIPMPERWRKQLQNPDYNKHLERQERHRWEMDHILTGPVPSRSNVTELLRSRGRLNFALIHIDSVVTETFNNIDSRKCFAYTVYLNEAESFPYYIWEQHVNSHIGTEKFQAYYQGLKGEYKTAYWVELDPNTGIPCQEREVKQGTHTMVNPATGDTATFQSRITLERLYTVKK